MTVISAARSAGLTEAAGAVERKAGLMALFNVDPKHIIEVWIGGRKLTVVPGSFKIVQSVLDVDGDTASLWDPGFAFEGESDAGEGIIAGPVSSIEAIRLGNPRYDVGA